MLSPATIRKQRTAPEAAARAAVASQDREAWLLAIGGVGALDVVFCDEKDLPAAEVRIPFADLNC